MLSTLRLASRTAVARESAVRNLAVGLRASSTWANVPQGPPVSAILGSIHGIKN